MIRRFALFVGLICAAPVWAVEMSMPTGSRLVSDRGSAFDSYDLPVGPWQGGTVETVTLEGRVDRQSWRVESGSITTLQLLDPLRTQLREAGLDLVFDCDAQSCGGFDFRFAIEVIPTPDMYVDIRDYRFLAARGEDRAVSLLISRSRTAGYVQIIQVSPADQEGLQISPGGAPAPVMQNPDRPKDLAARLVEQGHVTLDDLEFEIGSTNLGTASYDSLASLAAFLLANPSAVVALVGHTDASGALDVNISVSRERAASVLRRLVEDYAVPEAQLRAEGMGYLAPRASHLTAEGRELNRRVEAVLLALD
ncbi:OmpA family protein [Aestuariivita boseongensis]|uniref:OmpA family protein n=1 Tax=Aestuariivita boseongensis TaxID=1470562 RepID=UPI0006819C67|nr:OmpA family protein [Aestuariivita boseongensis]